MPCHETAFAPPRHAIGGIARSHCCANLTRTHQPAPRPNYIDLGDSLNFTRLQSESDYVFSAPRSGLIQPRSLSWWFLRPQTTRSVWDEMKQNAVTLRERTRDAQAGQGVNVSVSLNICFGHAGDLRGIMPSTSAKHWSETLTRATQPMSANGRDHVQAVDVTGLDHNDRLAGTRCRRVIAALRPPRTFRCP